MKKSLATESWLTCPRPIPHPDLRLFCFPYAGRGASIFHHWPASLPGFVEVRPVQLPGREGRFRQPPFNRLLPLVEALAEGLGPWLDRPFAFFGHSMGALVSFELARELRRRGRPGPSCLVVSGHGAPQLPPRTPPLRDLPDDEFLAKLSALGGLPDEAFRHAELLSLLLPVLRADFTACETYVCPEESPLACPISAYGGLEEHHTPREDLEAWNLHTTGRFRVRQFPGGHFFLHSAGSLVLDMLAHDLMPVVGA